ncbi:MAG: hypothetical protein WD061_02600 [Candidatus Saccharimonadales bacterium]
MSLEFINPDPTEAVENQQTMTFKEFVEEIERHQEPYPEADVLIIDKSWYEGLETAYENYLVKESEDREED